MITSSASRSFALFAAALVAGALAAPRAAAGAHGDCSQPVSTGANPLASDCLFILRVAVGLQACTPRACVCDPTGDETTTASDALTCLKKAVAEPIALLCPCSTTTSSTTTTTTVPSDCTDDGDCTDDDCVCSDCDADLFCSDPANCQDDGTCDAFAEGCVCADCAAHPECTD